MLWCFLTHLWLHNYDFKTMTFQRLGLQNLIKKNLLYFELIILLHELSLLWCCCCHESQLRKSWCLLKALYFFPGKLKVIKIEFFIISNKFLVKKVKKFIFHYKNMHNLKNFHFLVTKMKVNTPINDSSLSLLYRWLIIVPLIKNN